jgi:hypothetical protein
MRTKLRGIRPGRSGRWRTVVDGRSESLPSLLFSSCSTVFFQKLGRTGRDGPTSLCSGIIEEAGSASGGRLNQLCHAKIGRVTLAFDARDLFQRAFFPRKKQLIKQSHDRMCPRKWCSCSTPHRGSYIAVLPDHPGLWCADSTILPLQLAGVASDVARTIWMPGAFHSCRRAVPNNMSPGQKKNPPPRASSARLSIPVVTSHPVRSRSCRSRCEVSGSDRPKRSQPMHAGQTTDVVALLERPPSIRSQSGGCLGAVRRTSCLGEPAHHG